MTGLTPFRAANLSMSACLTLEATRVEWTWKPDQKSLSALLDESASYLQPAVCGVIGAREAYGKVSGPWVGAARGTMVPFLAKILSSRNLHLNGQLPYP